jgi:predicted TPR repeat methyltransferase
MTINNNHQAQYESAADYDRLARVWGWYSAEVLFGLCYEYVRSGECLLDIGIGTGLCAFPFTKAGLQVYGMDLSLNMVNAVKLKGITVDLKQFDIRNQPWPYPDGYFDHLIACGVLHFFSDLAPIFLEASRLVRSGGLFAFTTKAPQHETTPGLSKIYMDRICNVTVFLHNIVCINALIVNSGFKKLKKLEYMDAVNDTERRDPYYAWVSRKIDHRKSENLS